MCVCLDAIMFSSSLYETELIRVFWSSMIAVGNTHFILQHNPVSSSINVANIANKTRIGMELITASKCQHNNTREVVECLFVVLNAEDSNLLQLWSNENNMIILHILQRAIQRWNG